MWLWWHMSAEGQTARETRGVHNINSFAAHLDEAKETYERGTPFPQKRLKFILTMWLCRPEEEPPSDENLIITLSATISSPQNHRSEPPRRTTSQNNPSETPPSETPVSDDYDDDDKRQDNFRHMSGGEFALAAACDACNTKLTAKN